MHTAEMTTSARGRRKIPRISPVPPLEKISGVEYANLLAVADFARRNTFGPQRDPSQLLQRWADFHLEYRPHHSAIPMMRRPEELATLREVRDQIHKAEREELTPEEALGRWTSLLPQLTTHQHLPMAA